MAAGAGDARPGLYAVAGGGGGPGGGVQAAGGADSSVLGLHEHHSLHGRAGCLHTSDLSPGAPGRAWRGTAFLLQYCCGWMCRDCRPNFVVHLR